MLVCLLSSACLHSVASGLCARTSLPLRPRLFGGIGRAVLAVPGVPVTEREGVVLDALVAVVERDGVVADVNVVEREGVVEMVLVVAAREGVTRAAIGGRGADMPVSWRSLETLRGRGRGPGTVAAWYGCVLARIISDSLASRGSVLWTGDPFELVSGCEPKSARQPSRLLENQIPQERTICARAGKRRLPRAGRVRSAWSQRAQALAVNISSITLGVVQFTIGRVGCLTSCKDAISSLRPPPPTQRTLSRGVPCSTRTHPAVRERHQVATRFPKQAEEPALATKLAKTATDANISIRRSLNCRYEIKASQPLSAPRQTLSHTYLPWKQSRQSHHPSLRPRFSVSYFHATVQAGR